MSNMITAFFKGRVGVAEAVYQNDYGIVMNFDSIELPAHFDCYFSTTEGDEAIPGIGADRQVVIPNECLSRPGNVVLHIPIHTGANDSEVEYAVYFKVIGRARPMDDGTPVQMTAIEQALALLQNPIGNIEQIVNEALAFTGDTFAEMQAKLDEKIADVESDFDNLDAQFQTAVSALTVDSEVQNIRVGADNVTYTSAGEAVRTQFSNLKSAISYAVEEIHIEKNTDILPTVTWTEGYYVSKNGTPLPSATLKYSNKISVSEGDVLSIVPTNSAFRYICAYSNDIAVEAKGAESVNTYTVPSGIDSVVLSAYISATYAPTAIYHRYLQTSYKNILDDDISAINNEIDSIESAITTENYTGELTDDVTPTFTTGAISANGTVYPSYTAFQYTQKISVAEGDIVQAFASDIAKSMRFVCAYNGNTVVASAGSDDETFSYTVPSGVDSVVVTTRISAEVDTIKITTETTLTASYVKPTPMGYMAERGSLSDGGSLVLPYHNVKINNCYMFNANVSSFNSITFRKQSDTYITVNNTNLIIHNDQTEITVPHGLTIGHNIGLLVENETSYTLSLIKIFSDGNIFEYSTPTRFLMDTGTPTLLSTGSTLTDCVFTWASKNVNCPIWMFGDSYFSWYPQRWTYYLAQDGYTKDVMLNGYAGQASNTAYSALVNLLNITVPKQVVWCIGMNDPDNSTAVSSSWNSYYLKLIELKKKYGFDLILYTVPTTPIMENDFKNEIIRNSGYRYIEADKAVRIDNAGNWVSGALESDNVHPTELGAKIIYCRILADLPEIMCNC